MCECRRTRLSPIVLIPLSSELTVTVLAPGRSVAIQRLGIGCKLALDQAERTWIADGTFSARTMASLLLRLRRKGRSSLVSVTRSYQGWKSSTCSTTRTTSIQSVAAAPPSLTSTGSFAKAWGTRVRHSCQCASSSSEPNREPFLRLRGPTRRAPQSQHGSGHNASSERVPTCERFVSRFCQRCRLGRVLETSLQEP